MENENYSFSVFNEFTKDGIFQALNQINDKNKKPIIICIGSDLVLGDSLGPLVGTLLKKRKFNGYVYGTLNAPITAKEVEYAKTYIKLMHPNSIIIALDAAVGNSEDIGLIKIQNRGIKPGLGVNKDLGVLGDVGIIGIVAEKSVKNYSLFNLTRLNLVYKMAEKIADGIENYLLYLTNSQTQNYA